MKLFIHTIILKPAEKYTTRLRQFQGAFIYAQRVFIRSHPSIGNVIISSQLCLGQSACVSSGATPLPLLWIGPYVFTPSTEFRVAEH